MSTGGHRDHLLSVVWTVVLAVLVLVLPYGQCRDAPTTDGGEVHQGEDPAVWYPYQRTLNQLNARMRSLRSDYQGDPNILYTPGYQARMRQLDRDWVGLCRRLAQRDGIRAQGPRDLDSARLAQLQHQHRALVDRYMAMPRRRAGGRIDDRADPTWLQEVTIFEMEWDRFVDHIQQRIDRSFGQNLRNRDRWLARPRFHDG